MNALTFRRLCRVRDLVRSAPQRPVTLGELAEHAAMSRFQLIRRFRALFGATPHQFLIDVRIDRAKELLVVTDWSITRICLEVGFVSVGSFSGLFGRRVGMAPTAYRSKARAMHAAPRMQPAELVPGCLTLMASAFAISEKRAEEDRADCAP